MDLDPLHYINEINESIGHSTADVLEFLGITDPVVDPNGIRDLARHWQALGEAIDDAHWRTGLALGGLRWDGRASTAFHDQARQVRQHAQQVAGVLDRGHAQLDRFADQAHEMLSQIGVLCAQITEFELAALPLSLLTGPLSEVAANLAAGERAAKIVALIARLAAEARTAERVIDELLETLGVLGRALRSLTPLAEALTAGIGVTVGTDAFSAPDRLTHADTLEQDIALGALLGVLGGAFGKGVQGLVRGLGPGVLPALAADGVLADSSAEAIGVAALLRSMERDEGAGGPLADQDVKTAIRALLKGAGVKPDDFERAMSNLADDPDGEDVLGILSSGELRDAHNLGAVVSSMAKKNMLPGAVEQLRLAVRLRGAGATDIEFERKVGFTGRTCDIDVAARDRHGETYAYQLKTTTSAPKKIFEKVKGSLAQLEGSGADHQISYVDVKGTLADMEKQRLPQRLTDLARQDGVVIILRAENGSLVLPPGARPHPGGPW